MPMTLPQHRSAGSNGSARPEDRVLTINGGSSSIKFAIFDPGSPPNRWLAGILERIGFADAFLRTTKAGGQEERRTLPAADFNQAVVGLLDWLQSVGELGQVSAVGQRIVHGGPIHTDPQVVTPELIAELRDAIPFAPAHLPSGIQLIEAITHRLPGIPLVVCFDTAFHWNLLPAARTLPIPRRYRAVGIRRYGFHGLSFAYLLEEFERVAGVAAAQSRVVLAHLGSGASMAAVRGGRCIDTTMGLTPTSGLVMGTRTGDLDPGVLVYLTRAEGLSADQLEDLVTHQSGLLGVSETSSDVRDLLARQATDPRAAEAVELFCYQARKWVGALAAALGGIDALVFSGGIGENSAEIRARICEGLDFLGVHLDTAANTRNDQLICSSAGTVAVRVIPTDEEVMIAKVVYRILGSAPISSQETRDEQ